MDEISDREQSIVARRRLQNRLAQRKLRSKRSQANHQEQQQKSPISKNTLVSHSFGASGSIQKDSKARKVQQQTAFDQDQLSQAFETQLWSLEDRYLDPDNATSPLTSGFIAESWSQYPVQTHQQYLSAGGNLDASLFGCEPDQGLPSMTGSCYGQLTDSSGDQHILTPPLGTLHSTENAQKTFSAPTGRSGPLVNFRVVPSSSEPISRRNLTYKSLPPILRHTSISQTAPPTSTDDAPLELSAPEVEFPPTHKNPNHRQVQGKSEAEGRTTLHLSAENGHSGIVRCVLDFGAEIDARDASGLTALHLAVDKGHADVVEVLLEKGADTGIRDHRGWTAMHIAARNGCEGIIRLLIQRGVNLNTEIKGGSRSL